MNTTDSAPPPVKVKREPRLRAPKAPVLPPREQRSLVQWAADRQIEEVSKKLASIKQVGIRSEAEGDYFKSGDLAYQMQEIIRATSALYDKSRRVKG